MFLEVKEITFADPKDAAQSKNYPESGFYMVEIKDAHTDLRFVDTSAGVNITICPKTIFDGIVFKKMEKINILEKDLRTTKESETVPPSGYASESFILDFTRILLNQKK